MAEDNSNPLAKLPLPSIYAVAYAAIIYVTLKDLSENPLVLEWVAKGTPLDSVPWLSFSGGTVLIVYAATQLAQFAGVGKSEYYDDLEGPEVNSLSAQAAVWALAGEVPTVTQGGLEVATFAGGCFWGTELHFQRLPGVVATCVGYTQGRTEKPSYKEVCGGTTGHTEGRESRTQFNPGPRATPRRHLVLRAR